MGFHYGKTKVMIPGSGLRVLRNQGGILCALVLAWWVQGGGMSYRGDPEYLIDTWQMEDGLPDITCTAMAQTPDGYLWLGTGEGLVRYDGVRFTVFNPDNTPGLLGCRIAQLHSDRFGRLWVDTTEGLVVRGEEVGMAAPRWRDFPAAQGWSGSPVRTFTERANGDVFITTSDGRVMEFVNDQLGVLPDPPGQPGEAYLGAVDEVGQWWVAQSTFIGRWDGARWIQTVSTDEAPGRSCAQARDGGIWVLVGPELRHYQVGHATARIRFEPEASAVRGMFEDRQGAIWISTQAEGLFRVTRDGAVRHWVQDAGLSDSDVRFVFEDREGNRWVGTGGGLTRFKPRQFQSYGPDQGLPAAAIKSVWPHPVEGLWVASQNRGLFHLARNQILPAPLPDAEGGMATLQCVLADRAGRTWVGSLGQGLWRSDGTDFHRVPEAEIGSRRVNALFEDSKGQVWIAGQTCLVMCRGDQIRRFGENGEPSLPDVVCFGEDANGTLWLATRQRVFRWENDRLTEVTDGGARALGRITCLQRGDAGAMWMGSEGQGLRRWRRGQVTRLGRESGLPFDNVRAILDDHRGSFWITSKHGIMCVNRRELEEAADGLRSRVDAVLFDRDDGLPGAEGAAGVQPACARDASGHLWFAMVKGLATTHPTCWRGNRQPTDILIEQIAFDLPSESLLRLPGTGGKPTSRRTLSPPFGALVELPAGSRHLEIAYTAPSFFAPERKRFQVLFEGAEMRWQDVGNQRLAEFHEPRSDHPYRFRVRATDSSDAWHESSTSLAFVVRPFYWQTPWFRVVVATGLLGLGAVLSRWRLGMRHRQHLAELVRTRRQQSELEHFARVSTMGQLACSLAHELNQPLSAILRNTEAADLFLRSPRPDLDELRAIVLDIQKDDLRAGAVIDHMRGMLRLREPNNESLDLQQLARDVCKMVETNALERGVRLIMVPDPNPRPIRADRVQLQQVLLNLALNAIDAMQDRPPATRLLEIRIRSTANSAELAVKDTGCGIPPDKLAGVFKPFVSTKPDGLGMGLTISKRLVEAHGGLLRAQNNPEGGATFTIILPRPREEADS